MSKKRLTAVLSAILISVFSVGAFAADSSAKMFFHELVNFPLALVLTILTALFIVLSICLQKPLKKLLGRTNPDTMLKVFIVVFAVFGIGCLVYGILSRGGTWSYMMHVSSSGLEATQFENYFHGAQVASLGRFFELDDKYSPTAIFMLFLISHFFPEKFDRALDGEKYIKLLQNTTTMLPLVILIIVCFFICYYIYQHILRKNGHIIKNEIILFLIVFSFPVTYAIELADITSISFVFASFFILFKDSENHNLREAATIVLALAGSMNIVVFVFAFLYAINGKWSRLFRTFFYGAVFFIVPAFVTGLHGSLRYVQSVFSVSGKDFIPGNGSIVNFMRLFGVQNEVVLFALFAVTDIIAFVCMLLLKKEYQKYAALAYIVMNLNMWTDSSCSLFMLIPLLVLLGQSVTESVDWAYLADFSAFLLPIPTWFYFNIDEMSRLQDTVPTIYKFTFSANQLLFPFALQGLLIILTVDLVREIIRIKRGESEIGIVKPNFRKKKNKAEDEKQEVKQA